MPIPKKFTLSSNIINPVVAQDVAIKSLCDKATQDYNDSVHSKLYSIGLIRSFLVNYALLR
jgi:hypothetical protein